MTWLHVTGWSGSRFNRTWTDAPLLGPEQQNGHGGKEDPEEDLDHHQVAFAPVDQGLEPHAAVETEIDSGKGQDAHEENEGGDGAGVEAVQAVRRWRRRRR